jgi:hypothetical protein
MCKLGRWLLASALVLYCGLDGNAVNDITNPAVNSQYFPFSNIACDGNRAAGLTVRVKLMIGTTIGADSGNIPAAPMETTWSKNFTAPWNGWTVSDDWVCHLYDTLSPPTELKTAAYKVVSP